MPRLPRQVSAFAVKSVLVRQNFDDELEQTVSGLIVECFYNTPRSIYRCGPHGPPVSASEYLVWQYEQSWFLSTQSSQADQARATQNALQLRALLDQLRADLSAGPTASIARLRETYQRQLMAFNGRGLDVSAFVFKTLMQREQWARTRAKIQ